MKTNTENLLVAVVSTTATSNKGDNIAKALAGAQEACGKGADWVCLPEMFAYHGPYENLWENAEFEDGPLNQKLAQFARKNNVILFAGSAGERPQGSNDGKIFNTQYVFGRDGSLIAKYRKTHLFNLLDAGGQKLYCESDGYLAGDRTVTLAVDGWQIGLATCYDLRFPDFFSKLNQGPKLDCLMIPSAFTLQTGMYHWSVLLRARAIEHLCYVIAPNQVGQHSPGKASYGHALIVDPWGTIIADTANRPSTAIATISKDTIASCRSQLPSLNNQRPELYRN